MLCAMTHLEHWTNHREKERTRKKERGWREGVEEEKDGGRKAEEKEGREKKKRLTQSLPIRDHGPFKIRDADRNGF